MRSHSGPLGSESGESDEVGIAVIGVDVDVDVDVGAVTDSGAGGQVG